MDRYAADESRLFDGEGQRKYLTSGEARQLLAAAARMDARTHRFCELLYYTGCRISEGLELTPRRLDVATGRVILRTLKRRRRVFRAVPVPVAFLRALVRAAEGMEDEARLFPWCRQTAWRRVKAAMALAGIAGPQASPKGFRHQYGCHGIECGLPESLLARLLGHASPKTTRIYTFVTGPEERALAERMWGG